MPFPSTVTSFDFGPFLKAATSISFRVVHSLPARSGTPTSAFNQVFGNAHFLLPIIVQNVERAIQSLARNLPFVVPTPTTVPSFHFSTFFQSTASHIGIGVVHHFARFPTSRAFDQVFGNAHFLFFVVIQNVEGAVQSLARDLPLVVSTPSTVPSFNFRTFCQVVPTVI